MLSRKGLKFKRALFCLLNYRNDYYKKIQSVIFPLLLVISNIVTATEVSENIISTSNFDDISSYIFKNRELSPLVLFDVDNVLITPVDFILKAVNPDAKKFMKGQMQQSGKNGPPHNLISVVMLGQKYELVTSDTAKTFNEIKQTNRVVALTAAGAGKFGKIDSLEDWRFNHLKEVGIDFSNASNGEGEFYNRFVAKYEVPNKKTNNKIHQCAPKHQDGIIYTCFYEKGYVLGEYLKDFETKPRMIIFIDDRLKNLKSVEEYCANNNIRFLGVHYTYVEKINKNKIFNKRLAVLQFEVLKATSFWLDDVSGLKILKKIENSEVETHS